MKVGINFPDTFSGRILNCEHIGKTGDDLVNLWNEQNPEDQVVSSQN